MNAVVEFRDVSKAYGGPRGDQPVLDSVDVNIHTGQLTAITGPSGAGKSTFLNLCALLDVPTAGEIRFDGQTTSQLPESILCDLRKHAVGMIFQQYCLLPKRSVLENVMFRYRYLNIPRQQVYQRALAALKSLGIAHLAEDPVSHLSGGEMQRVGIARAIALKPRLLAADEPTGNLDSESAALVMECLRELARAENIAVLLVTHNTALIRPGDRHLVCHSGQLREH